jgi:predicted AAA+ superfamily ATPase
MDKKLIQRFIEVEISQSLQNNPAVAILGPRQCGKTTLARMIMNKFPDVVYLDLEKPSDLAKLTDSEAFFTLNRNKSFCIDEVQRKPELFSVLRSIIDENDQNGQFLILGSASRDLIKQSSESLAGRIAYHELTPFTINEIFPGQNIPNENLFRYWMLGGFPRSFLASGDKASFNWRQNFIRTFLERDIPALDINIPTQTLERLWKMLAHLHGQIFNSSQIGSSLGVSHTTARKYIDLLSETFVIRLLKPYEANLGKRLVKSPKVYIRDSGILHALLDIDSTDNLLGHPIYGASWEGMVIENIITCFPDWQPYFYRTADGAEVDLLLIKGSKMIAVECKASTAPAVSKGFWSAIEVLKPDQTFIIAPVNEAYPFKNGVMVMPLNGFIENFSF